MQKNLKNSVAIDTSRVLMPVLALILLFLVGFLVTCGGVVAMLLLEGNEMGIGAISLGVGLIFLLITLLLFRVDRKNRAFLTEVLNKGRVTFCEVVRVVERVEFVGGGRSRGKRTVRELIYKFEMKDGEPRERVVEISKRVYIRLNSMNLEGKKFDLHYTDIDKTIYKTMLGLDGSKIIYGERAASSLSF